MNEKNLFHYDFCFELDGLELHVSLFLFLSASHLLVSVECSNSSVYYMEQKGFMIEI